MYILHHGVVHEFRDNFTFTPYMFSKVLRFLLELQETDDKSQVRFSSTES